MSIRQNQQAASDDFDAFIAALRRTDPDAVPSTSYRSNLREQLMENTSTFQASQLESGLGRARWPRSLAMPGVGRRALAFGATAALLVAVVVTALLINGNGGPSSNKEAGGFLFPTVDATPDGTPFVLPEGCIPGSPFGVGCNVTDTVGGAFISTTGFVDVDVEPLTTRQSAASSVEMQGWEVDPNNQVQFGPVDSNGAAIDFVVGGAYQAVFSSTAVVNRANGNHEYVEPGATVELGGRDSVEYPIGSKVSMANPLGALVLKVKTVVVYDGASPVSQDATGEFRMTVDGTGVLPMPLSDFDGSAGFVLTYTWMQVDPETLSAQNTNSYWYVLGPVASRDETGPNTGFVLWAYQPRG